MQYPGRIVRVGESDKSLVRAIKQQLNLALGIANNPAQRLDPTNGNFGPSMERAVRAFQARHVDSNGVPLRLDGEIGSITWGALFGSQTVPTSSDASSPLLTRALQIAAEQQARLVREVPPNSNRGPEVNAFLKRAGCPPGLAWCCAFVYWSMDESAKALGRKNPMVKTAGCLDHWQRAPQAGAKRITTAKAIENPALVRAGMIFIMDHGRGLGHTGFVEEVRGALLTTIEGNTDASMTREGGGVYRLSRKISDINKGFIDYAAL